jgi:hypothetical protein
MLLSIFMNVLVLSQIFFIAVLYKLGKNSIKKKLYLVKLFFFQKRRINQQMGPGPLIGRNVRIFNFALTDI